MRSAFITLVVTFLGTVLGGWVLVWLPADAAIDKIRSLEGVTNGWGWVTTPVQMPAWYFMVSALVYVVVVILIVRIINNYSANKSTKPVMTSDDEKIIRVFIAEKRATQWLSSKSIAEKSSMNEHVVMSRLETLETYKFVTVSEDRLTGKSFRLAPAGREYGLKIS